MKNKLTLYSINNCSACDGARRLLTELGFEFDEIKVEDSDDSLRKRLVELSGRRGFPQVFAGRLPLNSREQLENFAKVVRHG